MFRHVLRPVTLADGTHLPAGTTVVTPTLATHLDGAHYADAGAFDALRFYRPEGVQPALVTTSADYVAFGHGKHAWCVSVRAFDGKNGTNDGGG